VPFDLATAAPIEPDKARFDLSSAKPVEEAAPERSVGEQVLRAAGRTVRAGVQGVTAIPNMIGDAFGFKSSEAVRNALTKFGLPVAENDNERIAEDVASGMAGAGGMVGAGRVAANAGNALVKRVGEFLATAPATQVASGATGAGAAGVVREEGGGEGAQLAAGFAGAGVPALAAAARASVRGAVRGGETGRQRVQENIDAFEDAGAGVPTVGQATETRMARAVESGLSKAPGAAGRMVQKAEAEAGGMGSRIEDMATQLAPRAGAEPAGRAISSGIKDFTKTFKSDAGKLYDDIDRFILPESKVRVGNTMKALDELTTVTPGAANLSLAGMNPKIVAMRSNLAADAQSGTLPYAALKSERTRIGEMLGEPSLTSDVPRSQLKQVYKALTADLEAAAADAGPEAVRAVKRANRFYASGMKRIDDVLEPILKKGDPEDIFKAAVSGTKEGATTIRGVMKSIPEESQKVLASTMLRRLGRATPGQQNELGEAFSAETFLTNWNRIAPEAKKTLFSPMTPAMRSDLDKVAAVAANMREGSKVFANPSGTAQATANHMTAGAALISVLTGNFGVAAGIAGGVASSNLSARLMTNPDFVRFLAGSTKAPVEQIPAQLNQLFQHSMYMKRDERRDVREFIKQTRGTVLAQAQQPTQ
jgi:hypothetical protein